MVICSGLVHWLRLLPMDHRYEGSCHVVGVLRYDRGKILSENNGITLPSVTHCQGKIYFQVHIPSKGRVNHKQARKGQGIFRVTEDLVWGRLTLKKIPRNAEIYCLKI